jgi:hypothetical protein
MSPDLRAKLRDIKISILVYETRRELSKAYINSRWYRPGDRIGPEGYLLESVVRDGIILDYGEGLVKISSGH